MKPFLVATLLVVAGGAASATAAVTDRPLALIREHCGRCHGKDGEVNGDVDLLKPQTVGEFTARPELLERMIEAVRDREMPPEDDSTLKDEAREQLVAGLEAWLAESLKTVAPPPRTPVRRMNRFQYANAVEDLFALKVELFALPERILREYEGYFQPASGKMPDTVMVGNRALGHSQLIAPRLNGVAAFPQDLRAEHGFDNRGDLITLSPLLMESFLTLSRSILYSPDFGKKTCGKFNPLFADPPPTKDREVAIRQRLREVLTLAFRRPVEKEVLERYAAHATARLQSGASFTDAMKEAVSAALVSPRFLYLYDGATTGDKPEPVDDFELASRLSFFLWSSLPDEELLELAAASKLRDPIVLAEQAERMMNDRRMKRFCDAFAPQWLKLEHAVASEPKKELFRDFYFATRGTNHMMLEPLLVFETVLVEDRSILEFIQSDFTYRSEALESFYRKGPIVKTRNDEATFHRVPVSDKREGGVITTAVIMTMTSNAQRTQPITRGAWIVSSIFNDPPPPPPADVPPLEEDDGQAQQKNLSLREKLALHQQRADCAACHAKIDPYGFALENYDAVGRWRDLDERGKPIDPSGMLFNRLPFANIEEFKDGLLAEKDRFTRAFAAHLLAYALGREVKPADGPALDEVVRAAAADDYRFRALMKHVVLSEPFRMKFNPADTTAAADAKLQTNAKQ